MDIDEAGRARAAIVEYLRHELIGPRGGVHEEVTDEPFNRYTMGTLYPRDAEAETIAGADEQDATGVADGGDPEDQADDPIVLANQYLPASMGLSFFVQNNPTIEVAVNAACYRPITNDGDATINEPEGQVPRGRKRREKRWRREPVAEAWLDLSPSESGTTNRSILAGMGRLTVLWRQGRNGWLVTVAVINARANAGTGRPAVEDCLYQVEVRCRATGTGRIAAYPRSRLLTDDPEEHLLDLLYRHQVAYGVGHGCSVIWDTPRGDSTAEIRSEFLPAVEVPPVVYDLPGYERPLNLHFLAHGDTAGDGGMIAELDRFVDGYGEWIDSLSRQNDDIPDDLTSARDTLLARARAARERMSAGVRLLERDARVRGAFRLANRAMLMQMLHSGAEYAGQRRPAGASIYREPTSAEAGSPRWRPFQLAFQLLTVSSVAYPEDPFRQTVDLIWFPTGGGKTEAYLAVAAFLIFYRRMVHGPSAAGTAVLMRYTLRLLTTQQFRRAATLICACEQLRRAAPSDLGNDPVSIGLWVGSDTTPNHYQDAYDKYRQLLTEEEPRNPFQLEWCPWCGTDIVPSRRQESAENYGIDAGPSRFYIYCPNATCPFHQELPVGVIDQQLYDHPPTLLLATVDKFARLPWEERVGEFFGGSVRRPPDLIIQDELHLISGPLGTIVGLYETAIDALASWDGTPPKILASTATIRRAVDQCLGLYARDVALFPPSGLEAADSYFARYDTQRVGRLYVGVMGPAHTASTTMIRTSAAVLQAPLDLTVTGDALDAYWTLVAYHNSLRELGKSLTFGSDDIPARIKVIAEDQARIRRLGEDTVAELTSNVDAPRLSGMLDRLARRAGEDGAISFLLCTNMLSVGVDVSRLGLMLVNGQPKSTSEYIQASSRVGRGNAPGLVVCVYSPSKPRDRSHYERFVAYHSALYRQVEPTSVTPFTVPARLRALHAVLVSLVRHRTMLSGNGDAGLFRLDLPQLQHIIATILNRIRRVDEVEAEAAAEQLDMLVQEWAARAEELGKYLVYSSPHRSKDVLLRDVGDAHVDGWETLQSMRNVDRNCNVSVMGARK